MPESNIQSPPNLRRKEAPKGANPEVIDTPTLSVCSNPFSHNDFWGMRTARDLYLWLIMVIVVWEPLI